MRVNNRILIQSVEEHGVVVLDEVTDQEVVIPMAVVGAAIGALSYFSTPHEDATGMPTATGYYVDVEGDMWRVEPDGSVFYTGEWRKQLPDEADEDARDYGPFRRLA